MSTYKQKQHWKIWLAVTGLLIVVATVIYTNFLVNRIAQEERKKVVLWAEAIQKRAELVNKINVLFKNFEKEDRKNSEFLGQANYYIATAGFDEDIDWASRILRNNTNIPVIIVDGQKNLVAVNNYPDSLEQDTAYLLNQVEMLRNKYPPIDISYQLEDSLVRQYLFYDDSKIYSQLKKIIDELVESFVSETVINAASVPVVFTNGNQDSVISYGNIEELGFKGKFNDKDLINAIKGQNTPIIVELEEGTMNYIFYRDSYVIRLLKYFPYILLAIVSAFLLVAYLLFSTARRNEQNQVWVGLSKETAHQLGTPITSLVGWVEVLRSKGVDAEALLEMEKDIWRLQIVTERFSKIGSQPELKEEDLFLVLDNIINYMKRRSPGRVQYEFIYNVPEKVEIPMNKPLLEWVIENLCRNSLDALTGAGKITFEVTDIGKFIAIDVTDTGKGMPKKQFKTVFKPGYTTKKRGWGLGLSLTKRIVEEYHKGKIFVKWSEPGKGTTFRILLRD